MRRLINKKSRQMALILVISMILQMVIPNLGAPIYGNETAKDLGNIFAFKSFTYSMGDEDYPTGYDELEDGIIITPQDGLKLVLEFKWDTEGLDVQEDDFASIMLPE